MIGSTPMMAPLTTNPAPDATNLSPRELEKVKQTAQEFEALFIAEMFNHMNEGMEVNPMFGGGKGEEMFRSMLNQEYGKIASKSGSGIGLADHIQKAMIDIQSRAGHAN